MMRDTEETNETNETISRLSDALRCSLRCLCSGPPRTPGANHPKPVDRQQQESHPVTVILSIELDITNIIQR